eukprot:6185242-Pleurochrysis_carterae.AAC.1
MVGIASRGIAIRLALVLTKDRDAALWRVQGCLMALVLAIATGQLASGFQFCKTHPEVCTRSHGGWTHKHDGTRLADAVPARACSVLARNGVTRLASLILVSQLRGSVNFATLAIAACLNRALHGCVTPAGCVQRAPVLCARRCSARSWSTRSRRPSARTSFTSPSRSSTRSCSP